MSYIYLTSSPVPATQEVYFRYLQKAVPPSVSFPLNNLFQRLQEVKAHQHGIWKQNVYVHSQHEMLLRKDQWGDGSLQQLVPLHAEAVTLLHSSDHGVSLDYGASKVAGRIKTLSLVHASVYMQDPFPSTLNPLGRWDKQQLLEDVRFFNICHVMCSFWAVFLKSKERWKEERNRTEPNLLKWAKSSPVRLKVDNQTEKST